MNNRFHADLPTGYELLTGEPERIPGDRYIPDPGRSIMITPEIIADEARRQAARETSSGDWKIKSSLSEDNLRTVKPKVKQNRVPLRPRVILTPPPIWKQCATGCGTKVRIDGPHDTCSECRRKTSRTKPCPNGCGNSMMANSQEAACWRCLNQAVPHKACSKGCGRTLKPSNPTGVCYQCTGDAKRHDAFVASRKACAGGCGRFLRNGRLQRADGLCASCGGNKDKRAARPERVTKAGATCSVCATPIKPGTKTGRCKKHLPKRTLRIVLKPATRAEYELDILWGSLSASDKACVLQGALEARP